MKKRIASTSECKKSDSRHMSRRDMLRTTGRATAAAGLAISIDLPDAAPRIGLGQELRKGESDTPSQSRFDYRLLLGWINDISHRPLAGKRWPITDVDQRIVEEYRSFLRTARDYGYNGITLWGLYATHAWPVPLKDALVPERRRLIDQILAEADKVGIKVLYGLGVYSWGFEEIIKHDPTTARDEGRRAWGGFQPDNGVAMCYYSESARQWMRDIVDLCVQEVGTQGIGFQSGDLGRCFCHQCRELSDSEFHSRVINETAEYVKNKYPDQILGMSAWGVDLGCGADALKKMTTNLDFLTDVTDQSARLGHEYRQSLTANLPCALGSLGGAIVVPPQRWARDRWFMPHARMTANAIWSLHQDGGRAFEFFVGPMVNPQYNIMTRYVGLLLNDPSQSCGQALSQVADDLFAPNNTRVTGDIVRWLLKVERAYMTRVGDILTGEFDFEPLKGETAGEPIYLSRLSPEALDDYGTDLERLAKQLPALAGQCRKPEELQRIRRCLENVMRDIQYVRTHRQAQS